MKTSCLWAVILAVILAVTVNAQDNSPGRSGVSIDKRNDFRAVAQWFWDFIRGELPAKYRARRELERYRRACTVSASDEAQLSSIAADGIGVEWWDFAGMDPRGDSAFSWAGSAPNTYPFVEHLAWYLFEEGKESANVAPLVGTSVVDRAFGFELTFGQGRGGLVGRTVSYAVNGTKQSGCEENADRDECLIGEGDADTVRDLIQRNRIDAGWFIFEGSMREVGGARIKTYLLMERLQDLFSRNDKEARAYVLFVKEDTYELRPVFVFKATVNTVSGCDKHAAGNPFQHTLATATDPNWRAELNKIYGADLAENHGVRPSSDTAHAISYVAVFGMPVKEENGSIKSIELPGKIEFTIWQDGTETLVAFGTPWAHERDGQRFAEGTSYIYAKRSGDVYISDGGDLKEEQEQGMVVFSAKSDPPSVKVPSGTWMKIVGRPKCYVWNRRPKPGEIGFRMGRWHPKPGETAFWTGGCAGGQAHGTGTLTWRVDGRTIEEGSGSFVNGKATGHWVLRFPNGRIVDVEWDGNGRTRQYRTRTLPIPASAATHAELAGLRELAEAGDAAAQVELGERYEYARDVEQDYGVAVSWFRRAAEQGHASGQAALGFLYASGFGVPLDYAEAVRWYRRAAEQGNVRAQYNLGVSYRAGHGVAQDYREAVRWFRRSAEQGLARGQTNLGRMYAFGWGVRRDRVEAVRWYRRAAEQGFALGQTLLGRMYERGWGVRQDYVEAVRWHRRAAEQGFARGQINLGGMYEGGQGVRRDRVEAIRWYRLAARQGNEVAQRYLERTQKNIDRSRRRR